MTMGSRNTVPFNILRIVPLHCNVVYVISDFVRTLVKKRKKSNVLGRFPHFLEIEFFDASFIGGDGGALDADIVLLDGIGGIYGDLIVGFVSAGDGEIVVFGVDVYIGKNEFLLDRIPDDSVGKEW